jgi:hypothetical protein
MRSNTTVSSLNLTVYDPAALKATEANQKENPLSSHYCINHTFSELDDLDDGHPHWGRAKGCDLLKNQFWKHFHRDTQKCILLSIWGSCDSG